MRIMGYVRSQPAGRRSVQLSSSQASATRLPPGHLSARTALPAHQFLSGEGSQRGSAPALVPEPVVQNLDQLVVADTDLDLRASDPAGLIKEQKVW